MPEEQTLRLSDAFKDKSASADVELTVRMLNINHGHNSLLMERCGVLKEYSEFVDITRIYLSERKDTGEALSEALQEAGQTEAYIREKIAEKYSLSETEAEEKLLLYWK